MFDRKYLVPILCGLVGVGGVVFAITRPSDEAQIRQTLARVAAAVAPHPNEQNIISTIARINGVFKETLTERVEIRLAEVRDLPSARSDLSKSAAQVAVHYANATMDLACSKVDVAEDAKSAKADCVVTLKDTREGREDQRRVNFALRKDDGWRITTINVADRGVR